MSEPSAAATDADRRLPLPAVAAGGMLLWVVAEFALRRGLVAVLAPALGSGRGADALVLLVGFPPIAAAVALLGRRAGVRPSDWDYLVSLRAVGTGPASVALYFLLYPFAVGLLSTVGLGVDSSGAAAAVAANAAVIPTWAAVLLLVGNGVAVPVAEELAWRGVVQTALAESYGTAVAVALTAAGFVLKHLVVGLAAAPPRVASLVILAAILGVLRARHGTASSTVAHLCVNLLATAALVLS